MKLKWFYYYTTTNTVIYIKIPQLKSNKKNPKKAKKIGDDTKLQIVRRQIILVPSTNDVVYIVDKQHIKFQSH